MSAEDFEALHQRFLAEHTPVSFLEGDVFFLGWTSPRAWWEDDEPDERETDLSA